MFGYCNTACLLTKTKFLDQEQLLESLLSGTFRQLGSFFLEGHLVKGFNLLGMEQTGRQLADLRDGDRNPTN